MYKDWLIGLAILAFAQPARASDASDCHQEEDMKLAISGCTALILKEPRAASAYIARGDAYRATGDVNRALADYAKALEIDPGDAEAYYRRGAAYRKQNDPSRAVADYTKAVEIDPKLYGAYFGRAEVYREKGDFGRALADYDAAIGLNPRATWAYLARGAVFMAKGEPARAVADYTKAIEINPRGADAYFARETLFATWDRSKRRPPIIRASSRCVQKTQMPITIAPGPITAWAIRSARWKTLAKHYKSAPTIQMYLTRGRMFFELLGRRPEAILDYERALRLNPDIEGSKEGLKRLGAMH